jgi:hypothetical protein
MSGPVADERGMSVAATTLMPRPRHAVWGVAGAGAACVVAGVLLALGPPADVGTIAPTPLPRAAASPAAGTVPVSLTLPDRGVTAPVVPVATAPDGGLVVPDPPTTVGWWSPGALAGASAGTTVLAGHVDSAAAGLGAFAVLRDVGVGERVVLAGADGRTVGYRVTARRELGRSALPANLFATGGPPRLVLVTCGGRFDWTTRHYTDNVIVYADPARPAEPSV